ncbi:MAG: RNA methyltransferase [Patescibacteria group bacterium]
MITISSLSNSKIKDLIRLKKAGERRVRGLILIDGAREIEMAKKAGLEIVELFYCPSLIKKAAGRFFELKSEQIIEVTEPVFSKICYKEKPDGFLAVAKPSMSNLDTLKLSKNPLVVVLEAVEKPGNLGAIIRTAVAVGADALIINDNQTDIYNPNVIRASEGLVFVKPVVIASVEETVEWLKKQKIKSLAAATIGSKNYTEVNFKKAAAIILGSEANGLSQKWLKAANELIKIPMQEGIDSLNVSVSAAVIAYEVLRQRIKIDKS